MVNFEDCVGKHVLVSTPKSLPALHEMYVLEITKNNKFVKLQVHEDGKPRDMWFMIGHAESPIIMEVLEVEDTL